jgi:hypothetical protein
MAMGCVLADHRRGVPQPPNRIREAMQRLERQVNFNTGSHIMRPITINPALNGYICQVGCQTVVFESAESLLSALRDYLKDPIGTEKRFRENAVNKMPEPQPEAPGFYAPLRIADLPLVGNGGAADQRVSQQVAPTPEPRF